MRRPAPRSRRRLAAQNALLSCATRSRLPEQRADLIQCYRRHKGLVFVERSQSILRLGHKPGPRHARVAVAVGPRARPEHCQSAGAVGNDEDRVVAEFVPGASTLRVSANMSDSLLGGIRVWLRRIRSTVATAAACPPCTRDIGTGLASSWFSSAITSAACRSSILVSSAMHSLGARQSLFVQVVRVAIVHERAVQRLAGIAYIVRHHASGCDEPPEVRWVGLEYPHHLFIELLHSEWHQTSVRAAVAPRRS